MVKFICKVLGHKWDKKDGYEQHCKREGCYSFRRKILNTRSCDLSGVEYHWISSDLIYKKSKK